MPRLVVSGYYGFGNLGDEAILEALLASLHSRFPEAEAVVLSGNPRETERLHRVRAVHRSHLPSIIRELRRADLFLSGGGSLLQDVTSLRSLFYYLGLIRLARLLGCPVALYAQGVGPLERRLSRRAVARALRDVELITVRDGESAELLRELGVDGRVVVTADASLALVPAPRERVALPLERLASAPRPWVGVGLRPWRGGGDAEFFASLLELVRSRVGGSLILLPMHGPEDLPLARAVERKLPGIRVWEGELPPSVFAALVREFDLILAMRLHLLIFATLGMVPMVGLSYDPKVESFLHQIGLDSWCIRFGELDGEKVARMAGQALEKAPMIRETLGESLPLLKVRAESNHELVWGLLEQEISFPGGRGKGD